MKPLAPQRFAVQFTMGQSAHDKLRYAQELLSHELPSGNIALVLERALDALIPQLERRKFASAAKPRPGPRRPTRSLRHIPAEVMRAVWKRDQGQCTFVSEAGKRCPATKFVEFDHVEEVARGGEATVAGIRLRCRAHNQYQAACTFGTEFMRHKRIAAAEARAAAKGRAAARASQRAAAAARAGGG
ncbi:MAG: HNH endonuclease [Candidatus Eiseniibacteriota bacterium]